MSGLTRAAAYAVTALILALGGTYSGPSLAWELEETSAATSYLDHMAASPALSLDTEAADISPRSYDPNLTQEVAEHAVAPVLAQELPEAVDSDRADGRSLGELVQAFASTSVPDSEHECLAGAVYFESKGEPLQGQLAVAEVILNRAASGRFPTTICGVVKQRSQFSFVRGGRIPPVARNSEAWRKAVAIAHIAMKDLADVGIGKAMFFHARYVSPRWRLTRVASIGNHIFYR